MRLKHPVPGARVSQPFGANPGTYRAYGLAGHEGIDYAVPVGTPVLAAHDGTAWVRRGSDTYGDYVTVQSETVDTLYAHLSRVDVAQGAAVRAGETLGLSGNTGRSFGPHLHFGMRPVPIDTLNGYKGWVDPSRLLEESDMGLVGWHLGNGNAPTEIDWRIMEAVPPGCVVFLPDEGTQPEHLRRLLDIAPGCQVIMRPYYVPGAPLANYIDQCRRAMDRYWPVVPAAQRHLQAYNEPNMPRWATWEGFGDQPDDLRRYNDWFCETYHALKGHDPTTRLGGPALTPGNRDVWFPGDPVGDYYLHGPEGCRETLSPGEAVAARLQSLCADALALMDEIYAHVYVHEGRGAWAEPWRGLRFERLRRFLPGKPTYITECGYPSRPTWPDWGDAALIDWLGLIRSKDVSSIALWILGDKEQWGRPWYEGGNPRSLVWTLAEWAREAQPAAPPPDIQAAIGAALQEHIIPLNPAASFERAGSSRGLLPASREVDVQVGGVTYRAQAYRAPGRREWQSVVYCRVGEWGNLTWFERAN